VLRRFRLRLADSKSDLWFIHQYLVNDFTFVSSVGFDAAGGNRYTIDSKAMRKVNEDQDVVLVGEFSSTGSGFTLMVAGRLLIKHN